MKKTDSNQCLSAIVVGRSDDQLVGFVNQLLSQYQVRFTCCENIYMAVVEMAKSDRSNVLVIGRFSDLSREQGFFLKKTCEKHIFCCCFADKNLRNRQFQISAVNQTNTFIVKEPAEIEEVIKRLLTGSSGPSAFMKDDFLTTKAELDALLGA